MRGFDRRLWWAFVAAFALSAVIFVGFPQIDLGASALFYRHGAGFPLVGSVWLERFRDQVWNLSIIAFVLAAAGFVLAWARRPVAGLGLRDCGYVVLLYLLGPVLLANGILKQHWGRARPADIVEFGGERLFTPPLLPADQCADNCSFVSGEVSAAVVLALVLLLLLPKMARVLPGRAQWLWAFSAVCLPLATSFQRIATGRHFLSDTLFAVLLMLGLALILHRLIWRGDGDVF